MSHRLLLGHHGEEIASKYLKSLGYAIRRRNLRLGRDEVDLLAWDPEDRVLVFVEVKTRERADEDYPPELNVRWRKKACLKRSARRWVAEHDFDGGYRMDLVCIAGGRVTEHLKELDWE